MCSRQISSITLQIPLVSTTCANATIFVERHTKYLHTNMLQLTKPYSSRVYLTYDKNRVKKKTSKTLSTSHITIHLKYKNKKAKRNYCFPASVSIQTLMAQQIKNGFVIFAARKVWGFKIKAIRYLQPKNGSKCVREILNSPLLLSCLQLLQWHIFITPNNK